MDNAAYSSPLSVELITTILTVTAFLAGGLAYAVFKFTKVWKKLNNDDHRAQRLAEKEVATIRDKLIEGYKEQFELLKSQSEARIKELEGEVHQMRDEISTLRVRMRELSEENEQLRKMNISLQLRLSHFVP